MPELRELRTDEEWEAGEAILHQLWSHVSEAAVRSWREDDDYRLLGWYVDDPDDGGDADSSDSADCADSTDSTESNDSTDSANSVNSADDTNSVTGAPQTPTLVAVAGVYVQTVIHHERSLWVHDLVVDEAHRSQGHGEALLVALERWGEARGCDHLALVCAADNDEAAAFYDDAGMEPFGTVYEVGI